ncbi:MAG: PEP-CTERM sorting domain-containing protein [Crocosphaera sp.]
MKLSFLTASLLSAFGLTFVSSNYAASLDLNTATTLGDVLIESSDEAWLTNANTEDIDGDGTPFDDDLNIDYNTSGNNPVSSLLLESSLGLNLFSLTGFPDSFEGSAAIFPSLDVKQGDTLSFDWVFLTNHVTPDLNNNDYAFVTINDTIITLADTNSFDSIFFVPGISAPGTANFIERTGVIGQDTFTYTFDTTGTVTVGLGLIDQGDFITSSALWVENVELTNAELTSVPEPSYGVTILGLGMAMGISGFCKKKLSKRNK